MIVVVVVVSSTPTHPLVSGKERGTQKSFCCVQSPQQLEHKHTTFRNPPSHLGYDPFSIVQLPTLGLKNRVSKWDLQLKHD